MTDKPLCPECLERGVKIQMAKNGHRWSGHNRVQSYLCSHCGHTMKEKKGEK